MGKFDAKTKSYMQNSAVFADIVNFHVFNGKQVIGPQALTPLDTALTALPFGSDGKSLTFQKYRDLLKQAVIMGTDQTDYVLMFGIENQKDIHYGMPLKNLSYDVFNYLSQADLLAKKNKAEKKHKSSGEFLSGLTKEDRLKPVITIVVYFGTKHWDGALNIRELIDCSDKSLLKFLPDYQIGLVSPIDLSEERLSEFQSDFRELASFIHFSNDKAKLEELLSSNDNFKHLDRLTAELINDLTDFNFNLEQNERGEVNMCLAAEQMRLENQLIGEAKGEARGIIIGEAKGEARGIIIGEAKGEARGIIIGEAKGEAKGEARGENRIKKLFSVLLSLNRQEDIVRAINDEVFCRQLLLEFGLITNNPPEQS